jgi:hypothetical protein
MRIKLYDENDRPTELWEKIYNDLYYKIEPMISALNKDQISMRDLQLLMNDLVSEIVLDNWILTD